MTLETLQTLPQFQEYVRAKYEERGFTGQAVSELFHMWMEEIGEFARATRKVANIGSKRPDKVVPDEYALEAADMFIYLLGICNALGIDLDAAFKEKEKINDQRKWK